MTFHNPSTVLSNGAEVISDFIRSVGHSVVKKVSRRHSMGHYDRLKDPVISRSYQTMCKLPPTAEKEEPVAQHPRAPSVTSLRPFPHMQPTNSGRSVEYAWAAKNSQRRRRGSVRTDQPVLPVFLKTYNMPLGTAR